MNATSTGVAAAAIQVPAIHSCEVTTAAVAEAELAITSVRRLKRRSSSRSVVREEAIPTHHNDVIRPLRPAFAAPPRCAPSTPACEPS